MRPALLLAHDFPPMHGGIAGALGAVAQHSKPGRLVVSTGRAPQAEAWDAACGSRVDRVPVGTSRLRTPLGLVHWSRAALRLARETDAGFCWVGNLKPAGYVARWLQARQRTPYGLIVYGLDVLQLEAQARQSRRKRFVARQILGGASGTVAISHWTAARFRALATSLGLHAVAARVEVVPLGADPGRFHPGIEAATVIARHGLGGRRWLLTVARLVPHKGIDTVIAALALLPDVGYLVAGDGPDRLRLQQLAEAAGVADRVRFLGGVPAEDLPALYRAATVYVGLSREEAGQVEGFGLSLVEAQACGIPVVATTCGGIADAVSDGESGSLIRPNDPAAAVAAIGALLADDSRRSAMGQAGRARVEQYLNWGRVVAELERYAGEWGVRSEE